jgi:hypothetical protein
MTVNYKTSIAERSNATHLSCVPYGSWVRIPVLVLVPIAQLVERRSYEP